MIRSASLLAVMGALWAGGLWAGTAHAQVSDADLVTRIDRLQAHIRELTGTVEELQYRNQQLEQEVQRLRAGAPPSASPPSAQNSPPPRSSPHQYPPPAMPYPAAQAPGAIDAAPPPAMPSSVPSSVPVIAGEAPAYPSRRGDAFAGGAGTRRDRRCTAAGHAVTSLAIISAVVRTGHRRRSSCLSVTARRCLRSEPQSECAGSAATARQQH